MVSSDHSMDGPAKPTADAAEKKTASCSDSGCALPTYQFEQLSGESGAVHILLGDVTYVLRKTQAGKLILNK